jgi:anaerobic ribonucleoside-triphosphate reductase
MRERFELAARALGIKSNALKQFGKNFLPFLLQKTGGDTYFRLENCSRIINLAGFREAIEAFTEKSINSEESRKFAEETIMNLLAFKQKIGRNTANASTPSYLAGSEASERLAQLTLNVMALLK